MTSIKEALLLGAKILKESSIKEPLRDSRLLLSFVLNINKKEIITKEEEEIKPNKFKLFLTLIKRRKKGEPIQYITSSQFFFDTEIKLKRGVFIPRPETELLISEALILSKDFKKPIVVEYGCGSGAILKVLSDKIKNAIFIGIEKNQNAINISRENLKKRKNTLIIEGDYLKGNFLKKAHIVISNPPYLLKSQIKKLDREIKEHEPIDALLTPRIFTHYKKIIKKAEKFLSKGGYIIFEIGSEQAKRWKHFNSISPSFKIIKKVKDYGNKLRVIILKKN